MIEFLKNFFQKIKNKFFNFKFFRSYRNINFSNNVTKDDLSTDKEKNPIKINNLEEFNKSIVKPSFIVQEKIQNQVNDLKEKALNNSDENIPERIKATQFLLAMPNITKYLSFTDITNIIHHNRTELNIHELDSLLQNNHLNMFDLAEADSGNAIKILGSRLFHLLKPWESAHICKHMKDEENFFTFMKTTDILLNIILESKKNPDQFKEVLNVFRNDPIILNILKERYGSSNKKDPFSNSAKLKDAYERLGIDNEADTVIIDKAFRKLAVKAHPDRGGENENMQELVGARDLVKKHRDNNKNKQK